MGTCKTVSGAPAGSGRPRTGQSGFTLAALIIILTILMVTVAYTVPPMWSKVVQRDRDKQTLFIVRQYARAIIAFQNKNHALPVSLDQLKEARAPRLLRGRTGEWIDPLTGKFDWILLPPSAMAGPTVPGGGANYNPSPLNTTQYGTPGQTGPTATAPTSTTPTGQPGSPADYKGPFVGVRPNKSGNSYLMVKNSDKYEDWIITFKDVQDEANARIAGAQPPGPGGMPISGGMPGQPTTTRPKP
ncbi:MAG: type II secretion system protein [Acidobacteriota bacterium]